MKKNKCYNMQQKPRIPKYNPYLIPPSLQLCFKHRKCSQFGLIQTPIQSQVPTKTPPTTAIPAPDNKEKDKDKEDQYQCCPCCNSLPRTPLGVGCRVEDIYQVSQPAGYYFTYVKLVGILLVVMMMVSGIYTMVEIVSQCSQASPTPQQQCLYIYGIPLPKIHTFFKTPLIILNIFIILLLYMFSGYLFYLHTTLHNSSSSTPKSSDYSIMLSNFNHTIIKLQHLKTMLKQFGFDTAVQDIIYTHKIGKYLGWLARKSVLAAMVGRYRDWNQGKKVEKIERKIRKLDDLMLGTKNKFVLGQDLELRTDKVIITFKRTDQKKQFQRIFGLTLSRTIYHTFCGGSPLLLNLHPVYLQPLGEPSQTIWQNLEITSKTRYIRVFLSNTATILLLFGSFIMVAYLTKSQQDRSAIGDTVMSFVFAILIQVVNQGLGFLIQVWTGWEGRYTMTGEISVKLYKNCVGVFLNTTLLPFLLFVLDWLQPQQDDIIRNILSIFLISNLISPYLSLILQPQTLSKLHLRKKILRQGPHCLLTQQKSNKTFQKLDFKLDERYAQISQLVMNCMFYAAIFPVGILISIFGMGVCYWSCKWWLVRWCCLVRFTYRVGRSVNIISAFFPTVYAFGYAANLYMINKQAEFDRSFSIYIAVATIPITLLFILFGQKLAKKWVTRNRQSIRQTLTKKKNMLSYKNLNPTTFIHQNLAIQMEDQDEGEGQGQEERVGGGVERMGRDRDRDRDRDRERMGNRNMWENLVSYATARQSGILINQFNEDGQTESQSSRSSRSSRIRTKSNRSLN